MLADFSQNAQVQDYKIKSNRLVIPFSITANATPANKVRSVDLTEAMILACEGQTADAAAVDTGTNFTTPVDSTGIFGVLLYNLGSVKKVLRAEVAELSSGTATISKKGASSTGVTASGNIAVSIDSSLDLSSSNLSGVIAIDYIVAE